MQEFDVPSVLFAPSHLLATFPLGIGSALVLDVGYSEALVVPIFESVAMLNCWEASPAAGAKAVHAAIRSQLGEPELEVELGPQLYRSTGFCSDRSREATAEPDRRVGKY